VVLSNIVREMTDNSSSISSADWLELSNLVRETTDTSSISSEDWLEQDLPIETGLAEEDSLALKSSHVQVSHVLPSHFLPSQFLPSQVLPSQRKEEKGQFYNPSSVALWLLGMAVLSVITAGIVILTKSYKSEDATNNVFNRGVNEPILLDDSESPRLKMLREMLIPLSGIDSLSDSSSPQYAAMAWLADEDPAILDLGVTPFNTISDRYIVVLLYFGTTGNGWRAQRDFLTETNICEWNDGGEGGAFEGIRCLNNEVVDIILGTFCFQARPSSSSPYGVSLIYVTFLPLDMNSLKGTIPTEIGLFNLNSLGLGTYGRKPGLGSLCFFRRRPLRSNSSSACHVGANSLEGTIPTEIGAMKNLEKLSLSTWTRAIKTTPSHNL
jgi:hypothetical protein